MTEPIPWDEIDPPIRKLVQVLNGFAGIATIGSCAGHENPKASQWPAGSWYLKFRVARTAAGWQALEFLAWLVNNNSRLPGSDWPHLMLYPIAPPPYLNFPGKVLQFSLEGLQGDDPESLADTLLNYIQQLYVPSRGEVYSPPDQQEGRS